MRLEWKQDGVSFHLIDKETKEHPEGLWGTRDDSDCRCEDVMVLEGQYIPPRPKRRDGNERCNDDSFSKGI